mgnify:FL=1
MVGFRWVGLDLHSVPMDHERFLEVTGAELPEAAIRGELEERGFAVLGGVLEGLELEALRQAFEAVPGARETRGTRHMEELLRLDPDVSPGAEAFAGAVLAPRLLGAVQALLDAPFRLLHFGGRDPLPGFGLQGLHTDWPPRGEAGPAVSVTALVLLDDFRPGGGATRVVPGSHRLPGGVPRRFAQPEDRHQGEVHVHARAGDVLVFSSHLWHGGTRNDTGEPRRVLQAQFVVRRNAPPGVAEPGPWLDGPSSYLVGG